MKSYHALFVGLGLIGIIILYVIWNIGLFKPVMIEQTMVPTYNIIYKTYQGPYHDVGKVFDEVEKSLAQDKITCEQTFGRYYDDPNEVEPERTRADIGCILNSTNALPTNAELKAEAMTGYPAIAGTFEGAPWLTAFKVYKTLRKESYQRNVMLEDNFPIFETYEKIDSGFRTRVFFKLKQQ